MSPSERARDEALAAIAEVVAVFVQPGELPPLLRAKLRATLEYALECVVAIQAVKKARKGARDEEAP